MEKLLFTPAAEVIVGRLVALRKRLRLTQRQLARKLGTAPSVVAKVEMGERRLDLHEFYQFCKALNADPIRETATVMRELKKLDRLTRKNVKGLKRS